MENNILRTDSVSCTNITVLRQNAKIDFKILKHPGTKTIKKTSKSETYPHNQSQLEIPKETIQL